ncbi:drug resistance transporter, EmrB/QacA subfamily [bacterium A37T11]|nr:drug resistance transporter, EmrB/QacA subfamily [bacterium A37T11]
MEKRALTISLIVGGAMFMENLDATALSTALPQMAKSFAVSPVHMSAGITFYVVMLAVFIPVSGWVADRFGTRTVFSGAITGFLVSSIACGISQNLTQFVIARIFQGIAGAMMVPVGRLTILKNTSKKDLVTAIAYITWPGLIGPIAGPLIGGFFTTYFTWHWIFFINIPLGLLALALTHRYIPNSPAEIKRPLDWVGFILSGLSLSGIMIAVEMISAGHPGNYSKSGLLLLVCMLLMAAAVYSSKKIKYPLIDYSILKIRTFAVTIYSGTLARMVINMAPFLLPLMFQIGFGLNPLQAGALFMASMVGNLAMKPGAIWVTRKFDFRSVLIVNGLILVAITFVQALLVPDTPTWLVVIVLFVSGLSRSMQFSSLNTLAYADIPREKMSNANTLYSTVQQVGLGLGVALGAVALHVASLIHHTEKQYTMADFHLALYIVGIICFLSLLEYLRLKKTDGLNLRGLAPEIESSQKTNQLQEKRLVYETSSESGQ